MIEKRIKNPAFWVLLITGLIGQVMTAQGVDGATVTTWAALGDVARNFISNPYIIATSILYVISLVVDTSTPGIMDKEAKKNAES